MSIEFVGPIANSTRAHLEAFARGLENHPWGGLVEGRLAVASGHLDPEEAMRRELARWMDEDEYEHWSEVHQGRAVVTAGQVFVAEDGVVTAVVCPLDQAEMFVGLAAHELIEVAHRAEEERELWVPSEDPRESNGAVLCDEYIVDRARLEISRGLGWTESYFDANPRVVGHLDDLLRRIPSRRADPPGQDFWIAWADLARVWVMVAGRRAAGSPSAEAELGEWRRHSHVAAQGWRPVERALGDLYCKPSTSRDELVGQAADRVWDPIEQYGRQIWSL